ncbi:MAG: ArsA family ATPase [Candidatus Thorarchaeota archaeon]
MSESKFKDFVDQHPKLKFFFTGGKGGVGKTVSAAAIAQYFVSLGKKTLIASLNPIHSLSSLYGQEIWGQGIQKIDGAENLWGIEVDIVAKIGTYRDQLTERITSFLKWADIPVDPAAFIEIAVTNPAFEESAQFDTMTDIMLEQGENFDVIVFDCAAVANAIRLLGLSKIYDLWLSRMIESRKEALSLRVKLSFRKEKVAEEVKSDPMMADLLRQHQKMSRAKEILSDVERTAFVFVTIPLALPIAVVQRFITMVRAFDIPVGGVVVNRIIPRSAAEEDATEYMKNSFQQQTRYMDMIRDQLGDLVSAYVPLYPTEVAGVEGVVQFCEDMLNFKPE